MSTGPHGNYLGAVELIKETTYGVTPTNPDFEWLGYVQSAKNGHKLLTEDIKYLKSNAATTGRSDSHKNVRTGEEVSLEIEYIPQEGNLMMNDASPSLFAGAFCGDVVAPWQPDDTIPSYTIGMIDKWTNASTGGKEFNLYKGMMVQDFTFAVEVGTAVRCNATLIGKELAPYDADTSWIGTGSHASELSSEPLGASNISAIQMRATGGTWADITDVVNGLEINIANNIEMSKDLNSTATSKIAAAVLTYRDITVSLDVDYYDITDAPTGNKTNFALDDIIAFQSYDLSLLVDLDTNYYISLVGMRFPELPFDYTLEGIAGDKLTSLPLEGSATLSPIGVATTRAT